jgi:hypothetical protein
MTKADRNPVADTAQQSAFQLTELRGLIALPGLHFIHVPPCPKAQRAILAILPPEACLLWAGLDDDLVSAQSRIICGESLCSGTEAPSGRLV